MLERNIKLNNAAPSSLLDLPFDVLLQIFSLISTKERIKACSVNTAGFGLLHLENIWQKNLYIDFSIQKNISRETAKKLYSELHREKNELITMTVITQMVTKNNYFWKIKPEVHVLIMNYMKRNAHEKNKTIKKQTTLELMKTIASTWEMKGEDYEYMVSEQAYNEKLTLATECYQDVFKNNIFNMYDSSSIMFILASCSILDKPDITELIKLITYIIENPINNEEKFAQLTTSYSPNTLKILLCLGMYLPKLYVSQPETVCEMNVQKNLETFLPKISALGHCFRQILFNMFILNSTQTLNLLLDKCPNLLQIDFTSAFLHSFLHIAIAHANFEMVEKLIKKGADVNKVRGIAVEIWGVDTFTFNFDALCVSPLFSAVSMLDVRGTEDEINNLEKITKLLIQCGADLHQKCRPSDVHCNIPDEEFNESPLSRAHGEMNLITRFDQNHCNANKIIDICQHVIEQAELQKYKEIEKPLQSNEREKPLDSSCCRII